MKKKVFIVFSVIFISFSVLAQSTAFENLDFSASLSTEAGAGLWYTQYSGDFTVGNLTAQSQLKGFFESSSFLFDGKVSFDAVNRTDDKAESVSASLKETYYIYEGEFWAFKIGRQISTWGAADGLEVTNVLCPADYTVISSDKIVDQKQGIEAVKFSLNGSKFLVDAYFIPFFTPALLPLKEGSIMNKVLFGEVLEKGISVGKMEIPERNIKNCEYALRIGTFLPFADFSLYAFYGFDDIPFQHLEVSAEGKITLNGEYKRMTMFGFDSSIPVKDITVRLEGAFFPEKKFSTVTFETEKHNEFTALFGLDWMKGDWTVTAQYFLDSIYGNLDFLERRKYEHEATLSISRTFFGGNLETDFSCIVGLNDFDSVINPGLKYAFTDNFSAKLSAMFYNEGKEKQGNYGKYKDLSSVILKGEIKF
ncbi:hypothetical protein [Treponema sp.]|uniref:hypothetical protein n=1 Tax=Treponema sp. TaxID=166 RepID=UPI00388DAE98